MILFVALALAAAPPPLVKRVCNARKGCRVVEVKDASTPETKMSVVKVALPARAHCEPFEYWLVSPKGDQFLSEVCAAELSRDMITVTPNAYVHEHRYVGADRSQASIRMQLDPLMLVGLSRLAARATDGSWSRTSWDWTTFSGTTEVSAGACAPHEPTRRGVLVPRIDDPSIDWRTVGLGPCAARPSIVVQGTALVDPSDGSFAVVALGDALVVDVRDNALGVGGRSWTGEDHLELWAVKNVGVCNEELKQWGIRICDGAVFPGAGKPSEPLTVERAGDTRFRIALPQGYSGFALAYADSDDGATVKRLVATNNVRKSEPWSIGALYGDAGVTCRNEANVLVPVPVAFARNVPIFAAVDD